MKFLIISFLSVLASTSVHAAPIEFSEVLKNDQGEVLYVTSLKAANNTCLENNMTLPTAREIAELAMQRGAKGITEIEGASGDGYVVEVYTPGSAMDKFHFSQVGYEKVAEEEGISCLWTSSLNPKHPLTYHEYNVTFNPTVGAIHTQSSTYRNTIISCALKCRK